MLYGKRTTTKVVYGIRHRLDAWIFTDSKADRDAFWATVSAYPDVAIDWEICEKIVSTTVTVPEFAEQAAA